MDEFIQLLRNVDRYYKGFEDAVVSYIKMPGNACKQVLIEKFISDHPEANSSDVLEYMINEMDFRETYADYIFERKPGVPVSV